MKVWILSLSKRGFIQEPEIFYDLTAAENKKQELLLDFNPDYDDLDVFEKQIRPIAPAARSI
ncbi:MAG: hypothetical protein D4R93_05850 [Deltaproteobacteria bacterium]|nr:MAG: hypothetical protein D4R93_05850 [Deltaproteobacteria bacterium]